MVGEDQLGPELPERARVAVARCDVPEGEVEARLLELARDQLDVGGVVFEIKNAERLLLGLPGLPPARRAGRGIRSGGTFRTGEVVRSLLSHARLPRGHAGDPQGRQRSRRDAKGSLLSDRDHRFPPWTGVQHDCQVVVTSILHAPGSPPTHTRGPGKSLEESVIYGPISARCPSWTRAGHQVKDIPGRLQSRLLSHADASLVLLGQETACFSGRETRVPT